MMTTDELAEKIPHTICYAGKSWKFRCKKIESGRWCARYWNTKHRGMTTFADQNGATLHEVLEKMLNWLSNPDRQKDKGFSIPK